MKGIPTAIETVGAGRTVESWLAIIAQWIGHGHAVSRPLDRNNFSTTDSGRLSLYKLDAGSQPECNAHRVHRSGSVRNAKQGLANSENSERIGAPAVRSCTCALRRHNQCFDGDPIACPGN